MAKKVEIKIEKTRRTKKVEKRVEPARSKSSFFDYLRFGESYTSLILGILAVVVVTVLLLGFVHNRNVRPNDSSGLQATQTKGYQSNLQITSVPTAFNNSEANVENAPTTTPSPSALTPIPTSKKIEQEPTKESLATKPSSGNAISYTVKAGDSLWGIAEATYKSGYNWVDISRANNLSNPDDIKNGDKLVLPKVEQKNATSEPEYQVTSANSNQMNSSKITGNNYVVVKGDSLWSIAVRAYGDGYQWVKLSKVNNISNPDLILEGSKLTIPRN